MALSKDSKNAVNKKSRYSLHMINQNGFEIVRKYDSVVSCKRFAEWYPLEVFFAWIYDTKKDEMIYQNNYSNKFYKCSNESFVAYHC